MTPAIKVYALSTCHHCAAAKEYLASRNLEYDCVYVDRLYTEDRNQVMAELRRINPTLTFPTIVIGATVVAGFQADKIEAALEAPA